MDFKDRLIEKKNEYDNFINNDIYTTMVNHIKEQVKKILLSEEKKIIDNLVFTNDYSIKLLISICEKTDKQIYLRIYKNYLMHDNLFDEIKLKDIKINYLKDDYTIYCELFVKIDIFKYISDIFKSFYDNCYIYNHISGKYKSETEFVFVHEIKVKLS
jgi:hypothetical protein